MMLRINPATCVKNFATIFIHTIFLCSYRITSTVFTYFIHSFVADLGDTVLKSLQIVYDNRMLMCHCQETYVGCSVISAQFLLHGQLSIKIDFVLPFLTKVLQ
jgi:hypothetical protein